MSSVYNYAAFNVNTGEVIRGTSGELAKRFEVRSTYISKCALEGTKLQYVWQIKKETEAGIFEDSKMYRISDDLLREWDRVTAPFKRASRKGAGA